MQVNAPTFYRAALLAGAGGRNGNMIFAAVFLKVAENPSYRRIGAG